MKYDRKMFRNAIVRTPCPAIINGLTSSNLGIPDYLKALKQHSEYVSTLMKLGVVVKTLDEENSFPDSTFIEDVAICTRACAVITNPGAESRKGEITGMRQVMEEYYYDIEEIKFPGTVEGGDVMMVKDHFFIGISSRTNAEGADQLIRILKKYNLSGSKVPLKKMLHLKSGVSYLENDNLLVYGEIKNREEFAGLNKIEIDEDECYAANSVWINGKVLVPAGFPKSRMKIESAGYTTIETDMSEFRKVDGGLSCLSLRF
jgi:dimethylargininase